jgi:hypothetical protein
MRIARFNGGRIGLVTDDTIRDVTAAAGIDPAEWPPVGMVRVIANFEALRDKLAAAARSAPALPLPEVRLETPVPWPNKIIAYPTNYRDHAAEMSTTTHADLQGYFLKANSSLSGPNDAIELPDIPGREIHHECEIALVIGKKAGAFRPSALSITCSATPVSSTSRSAARRSASCANPSTPSRRSARGSRPQTKFPIPPTSGCGCG